MQQIPNNIDKKYLSYPLAVISGEVTAGLYIKQACQRYLDFFSKYDFRPEAVDRVVNFISKLKHFTGKHNHKSFKLLPFQYWIICAVFGFYYPNSNKRVCNYIYCEMSRKNGKTGFISAILLYMLIADGENSSEVELLATSAKQAGIAFTMCSNYLSSIDPKGKYFKRYRDRIKFDQTKSILQVLSSDSGGQDGWNSYCFCLDECHAQPNSLLWDVMVSSQGARENSLAIIITTSGYNRFSFCYSYRATCLEILAGLKEDDSQFCAIYTIDEEDDWQDENVWVKSNPALDEIVTKDYIKQQVEKAKNNSALEVGVKTKNLNIWCNSSETWISHDYIMSSTQKIDLNDFSGQVCYLGVDLASVSDLTALSILIPNEEEDKYYFKSFYYLPQSCLTDNSNSELYKLYKNQGFLTITSGNVTDYDYVLKDILKISQTLLIEKIGYDAYNATQFCINATAEGLPMEPYSQALWSFNKPTKEIERLIKMGKVVIDDNPITRWCFSNVVLKTDFNENVKPVKGLDSQSKIDGVISMVEALGIYLDTPRYNNKI